MNQPTLHKKIIERSHLKRRDPTFDSEIQAPTNKQAKPPTKTCKKHSCSPNNQNQANARERAKRMRRNEEGEAYL